MKTITFGESVDLIQITEGHVGLVLTNGTYYTSVEPIKNPNYRFRGELAINIDGTMYYKITDKEVLDLLSAVTFKKEESV